MCRATDLPVFIDTLWNPETCPVNLLPWLAWALSVDTWDSAWTETVKRRVVAESVHVHRRKGTLSSIHRVLNGFNIHAEISEWFQHGGEPYTFRLTAWADEQPDGDGAPILDASLYRNLVRAVNSVKPVRAHYDFNVGARFSSEIRFGSNALSVTHTRVDAVPLVQTNVVSTMGMPSMINVVPYVRIIANTV